MPDEKPKTVQCGESGFRLQRLELWNWGTFHGTAQVLEPNGGWALLVGDNGSGKSTAIDALRTLLVPPRMLNYNDASGDGRRAAARDRTRRSYVRGAWASSSTMDSTAPTTQYLRDAGVLSAVAAIFSDVVQEKTVTLAQVLWEHEEQIRELYAIIPDRRGLTDLLEGHSNSGEIRRAARRTGWQIEDSFAAYSERMRGLLHIPGDKALEVFNRAIGMKEVGDIDAFVRQFMLPSADTFAFIRDTVQPHYRTLLDCWSAIDRAERQIALLRPVAEHARRVSEGEERINGWRRLQELIQPYFATRHLELLRTQESGLTNEMEATETSRRTIAERLSERRRQRDELKAAIATTDVGPRLQSIIREIEHAEQARRSAQQRRSRVDPPAALLGISSALESEASFSSARIDWESRERRENQIASQAEDARAELKHRQELALHERSEKLSELQSVERNRVNIPRRYLEVRSQVAAAAGLTPEMMPFAGELIEVRSQYSDWTGAIERLLRGFGLSLLVPEANYRPSAEFINSTWLGIKLTFHRVPSRISSSPVIAKDRVPGRLEFRTEHPLYLWVAMELVRGFNHVCCDSIAELEGVDRGLTREGLVRGGTRHTKDDLKSIDDAGNRILGWSTDRKIAALRLQVADLEHRAAAEARRAGESGKIAEASRERQKALHHLLGITEFSEIDVKRWNEEVIRLIAERELLERNSDQLRVLRDQLVEIDSSIAADDSELAQRNADAGRLNDLLRRSRKQAEDRKTQLAQFAQYDDEMAQRDLSDIAGVDNLTLDNVAHIAATTQQRLQGRISNEQGRVNDAAEKMVAAMSEFLAQFLDFKQSLAVGRAYAESFASALQRIENEELPRHRDRFEQYLNENLIGDLLMLNRRLEEHQEAVEARIQEINEALHDINYRDDTFVQLRLMIRTGSDVAEFRRSLRQCFEHGIAPAPTERLRIFERVRLLIESFQRDPEATQRMTDVRNWFSAGVRELSRSDESELNYFAATTGKSGGQKARLAFTILASALSAQYGLSTAAADAPNFRLVVIDEAFSRTDEDNSNRAMQLFSRLGFQLLIVGPFDAKAKLAVPFVSTIHLASNQLGNNSRLTALTRDQVETAAEVHVSPREGVEMSTDSSEPSGGAR